jgi:regulation of enolase protein 1 (concanavalin A-like superfamily)
MFKKGSFACAATILILVALLMAACGITTPNSSCPKAWSCQDIGNPILVGSESTTGTTWTLQAGGAGATGTADQFHFVAQKVSGDMQVSAKVLAQNEAGVNSFAQAGLMSRQTADPGSPYYAVFLMARTGVVVQYRSSFSSAAIKDVQLPTAAPPLYLGLQRSGDQFQAATSLDGRHYTLVPGSTVIVVMPFTVSVGLAVSSDSVGTMNTALFSKVTFGLPNTPYTAPVSPSPCPGNWNCADV